MFANTPPRTAPPRPASTHPAAKKRNNHPRPAQAKRKKTKKTKTSAGKQKAGKGTSAATGTSRLSMHHTVLEKVVAVDKDKFLIDYVYSLGNPLLEAHDDRPANVLCAPLTLLTRVGSTVMSLSLSLPPPPTPPTGLNGGPFASDALLVGGFGEDPLAPFGPTDVTDRATSLEFRPDPWCTVRLDDKGRGVFVKSTGDQIARVYVVSTSSASPSSLTYREVVTLARVGLHALIESMGKMNGASMASTGVRLPIAMVVDYTNAILSWTAVLAAYQLHHSLAAAFATRGVLQADAQASTSLQADVASWLADAREAWVESESQALQDQARGAQGGQERRDERADGEDAPAVQGGSFASGGGSSGGGAGSTSVPPNMDEPDEPTRCAL